MTNIFVNLFLCSLTSFLNDSIVKTVVQCSVIIIILFPHILISQAQAQS